MGATLGTQSFFFLGSILLFHTEISWLVCRKATVSWFPQMCFDFLFWASSSFLHTFNRSPLQHWYIYPGRGVVGVYFSLESCLHLHVKRKKCFWVISHLKFCTMRKKFAFGYLWGEKSIWTMNTVLTCWGEGFGARHIILNFIQTMVKVILLLSHK